MIERLMDKDYLDALREQTKNVEPMIPKTIRLPKELLDEIGELVETEGGIKESAVIRYCILVGWGELKGR